MSLASWLGFSVKPLPPLSVTAQPILDLVLEDIRGQSVEKLWKEQPHLRTVVGFVARNIAQLGLHAYERDENDGRVRQRGTALSRLLSKPNAQTTGYELINATVADMCLYDQAFWYFGKDANSESGWTIRQIPPKWISGTYESTAFSHGGYKVRFPEGGGVEIKVPAESMLVFHGWDPLDPRRGSSAVQALKAILAEQIHAQVYRDQNWRKGVRARSYLSRPVGAPDWKGEPRSKFIKGWKEFAGDGGDSAGGVPLLEDGMELKQLGFSAKEDEYIEANKLSLATCSQVFHVNPTMIGLLDNANYSNVREFRRMLYGDTLGPMIEQIQQRVNTFLVPLVVEPELDVYVEFNIAAKLAGSFEEQASVMASAVGAPYMTVNEARAKQNMPAIDGGDVLIRNLYQTTTNEDGTGSSPPDDADKSSPPMRW
ncbi:phage portal protein [Rhodococcus globerulus]|uniref:Phage portal protein n=1 Tax=Rhodococcus globerulus TaxID=33008 RepID=A0ABU4BS72_RHOGO|nr:phage portal protein [Rhodococcus globerulus]MDV6267067.1 phage portal protein [Rhodococcus globerulus]